VALWEEIVVGWLVGFVLPKLIIVPIFRGMYRSMRATEALDAADRAELERDNDGGAGVRRHRRRPGPRRPGGLRARVRQPRTRA
jgi:hypothetical protein